MGSDTEPTTTTSDARERILAAALELFSERSFKDATTREIARRADVAQPLLNYHYRSKNELWRAAVEAIFDRLRTAMSERSKELEGLGALATARVLVRQFVIFSARNPQLHRIITQECKADSARMDYLVEQHVRPFYEATTAAFEQLVSDGVLPPIGAPHLFYILTGAGPSMFVLGPEFRRLSGLDPESDEVIEAHADAMCRLLFGAAEETD